MGRRRVSMLVHLCHALPSELEAGGDKTDEEEGGRKSKRPSAQGEARAVRARSVGLQYMASISPHAI